MFKFFRMLLLCFVKNIFALEVFTDKKFVQASLMKENSSEREREREREREEKIRKCEKQSKQKQ